MSNMKHLNDLLQIFPQLQDGYVTYNYSSSAKVFTFDYLPVNDGRWHYLEVRWPTQGQIILVMDYGIWQVRAFS